MNFSRMFSDFFDQLLPELPMLQKSGTETIIVAKALCTPARTEILKILPVYGVKIHALRERLEKVDLDGKQVPGLYVAKVQVPEKQAVWAEYLLLRSHKFMLFSPPKNKRNFEWASKHNVMPESWNGKPLIEKTCKAGIDELRKVKQKHQSNKSRR